METLGHAPNPGFYPQAQMLSGCGRKISLSLRENTVLILLRVSSVGWRRHPSHGNTHSLKAFFLFVNPDSGSLLEEERYRQASTCPVLPQYGSKDHRARDQAVGFPTQTISTVPDAVIKFCRRRSVMQARTH